MNKMFFLAAGFTALMMAACGGEKTEEKKEEKKEVSKETMKKFEGLKNGWSIVDGMLNSTYGAFISYDVDKQTAYLDSMKTVTGKAKKDIQDKAMPLIDSLIALNSLVADWKNILEGEKETWGMITEDFTSVITSIEKGDADESEILPRVEGFTEQFKYKVETLTDIKKGWSKIDTQTAELKALFAPTTK